MTGRVRLAAQALAVAVVAALLALLVWKVVRETGGSPASALARGEKPPAPRFTLPLLDRPGELSLASLRDKAVVLNFWASWCKPCKEEMPLLETVWRRYRARGLVVVGVDANDFKSDGRRFARRYGVTYPVVHDGRGSILDDYGVPAFPETFFVDRRGRLVRERIQGRVEEDELVENIELALGS